MPALSDRRPARWVFPAIGLILAIANPAGMALGQDSDTSSQKTGSQEVGHQLFVDQSCGTCHTLEDAGGVGRIGPPLDGNAALTPDHIAAVVADGQGAMPPFGGQLTENQIAALAAYIMAAKK